MKKFMNCLAIISLMAVVSGCSKSSNPVSQDEPIAPVVPNLVVSGINIIPVLSSDAILQKNNVMISFLMGNGTDFVFYMPSGSAYTFTGDSAKLLAGKEVHISQAASVTINNVEQVTGSNPPYVVITRAMALPDTNKGQLTIQLKK